MDPPPGVEPGLTDPKSVVLPLHQGGMSTDGWNRTSDDLIMREAPYHLATSAKVLVEGFEPPLILHRV